MVSVQDFCGLGNYIEIVMTEDTKESSLRDDYNEIDTDMTNAVFFKLLQRTKSKQTSQTKTGACFQKHYKEFVFRNMYLETCENTSSKIYKKSVTFTQDLPELSMRVHVFHKEKVPYHAFPATKCLHNVCYVSKATIKINNRVFLNFEKRVYPPMDKSKKAESFNKIYINYNHDDHVDITGVDVAIQAALQSLT